MRFKRVVSILLLPTILLTQWARTGHCHAENGDTPHIHLTGFFFDAKVASPPGTEHAEGEFADLANDISSDDEECVLIVPSALAHGSFTARLATAPAMPTLVDLLHIDVAVLDHSADSTASTVGTHDPPIPMPAPDCPIFLRHLTILI